MKNPSYNKKFKGFFSLLLRLPLSLSPLEMLSTSLLVIYSFLLFPDFVEIPAQRRARCHTAAAAAAAAAKYPHVRSA
jgi:hypothetical protein